MDIQSFLDGKNKMAFPKSCLLKSRWPYSMQSRIWVDKLKGLFQKSCFCSKVKMGIFYAEGHSMSDNPKKMKFETAPPQILIKLYTLPLYD